MAAMSILAALRARDASGEGQFIDVSMAHGTLALISTAIARFMADGEVTQRGDLAPLCYRPYRCSDGWITLAALEAKFWRNWCEGVGREDLIEEQFAPTGSDAHRAVEDEFAKRTRAEWEQFAAEHECCVEPVLDLDEVAESELVRSREALIEVDGAGAEDPVRQVDFPVRFSSGHRAARGKAPELGEHTEEVLTAAGYSAEELERLEQAGAVAGLQEAPTGQFLSI
jgi:crotonobetainyl-CoA:carnitine CoA-transferase CaiB-like acyl-CoA transferase